MAPKKQPTSKPTKFKPKVRSSEAPPTPSPYYPQPPSPYTQPPSPYTQPPFYTHQQPYPSQQQQMLQFQHFNNMPNAFVNPSPSVPLSHYGSQTNVSLDDMEFNVFDENTVLETPQEDYQPESEGEGEGEEDDINVPREYPNRAKSVTWQPHEMTALCKAWLHISHDKYKADQQTSESFWKRILAHFTESVGPNKRSTHQLNTKWNNMNRAIQLWNGCYNQMKNRWGSGMDDEGVMIKAQELYKAKFGKKGFNFLEQWKVVKDNPKWKQVPTVGKLDAPTGPSKRNKTSEDGNYTSSSHEGGAATRVPDLNDDSTPTGPSRARKGKTKVSDASSHSGPMADAISAYKNMKIKEMEEKQKTREKVAASKLSILEQQELDLDVKLFVKPHDNLPPAVMETVLERKRKIAAKYGWPCEF